MPDDSPLLITRISVPAPRAGWVTRERLYSRLARLRQARLAIITAPPGYGKTTLLVSWMANSAARDEGFRGAWLSLAAGDNDPVRFWSSVAGAMLHALQPALGEKAPGKRFLDVIRSPQAPPLENALSGLINEMAGLDRSLCLALDDYQVIESEDVHASLRFFIENLPETLRLVVASRSEPPVVLAKYRVRGWLVELHAADLRFTMEEAKAFFQDTMGLELSEAEVDSLESRTEGWAAALQLAALAIQNRGSDSDDRQRLIESFDGDDQYLLDYLTEEVLSHLPQDVQTFLMQTSLLDRFCAALCGEVTSDELLSQRGEEEVTGDELLSGRGNKEPVLFRYPSLTSNSLTSNSLTSNSLTSSALLLEYIEKHNLFIIPLDYRREWYRYHPLFASVLRDRLKRLAPERLPVLHRRAADWFSGQGMFEEAIAHAFAAGEIALAADLVKPMMLELIQTGERQILQKMLEGFPEPLVRSRPALCLGHAWIRLYNADFVAASEWAEAAECALQPGDRDLYRAQLDLVRSTVAINHKDRERAIELARRALPFFPAEAHMLRALALLNLGDAFHTGRDFEQAAQAFGEAVEEARACKSPMIEAVVTGSLGNLYLHRGYLREAQRVLQMVWKIEGGAGEDLPASGKPLSYLASLALERNELERAEETGRRAVALCEVWGHTEHAFDANVRLAEILRARGDRAGARQAVERARHWVDRLERESSLSVDVRRAMVRGYQGRLSQAEAGLALQNEDLEGVRRWLDELGMLDRSSQDLSQSPIDDRLVTVLTWYWRRTGEVERAHSLLEAVLAEAEAQPEEKRNLWRLVGSLARLAVVHVIQGDPDQAMGYLERALELAEPEGYVRTFLNQGEAMEALLNRYAQRAAGPRQPYLRQLLGAFSQGRVLAEPAVELLAEASLEPVREPLSDREQDVLRLLVTGRTYPEIAQALYLSVNTVKTHVKRLYVKLGVESRLAAVDEARRLGLIRQADSARFGEKARGNPGSPA